MSIKDFTDLATIASLIFAGYQFFAWRKQQIYNIRISTLLDMEDKYEIYIMSSLRICAGINQAKKDVKIVKSAEEKARINNFLKGEFREKILLATNESTQAWNEYSLYYFRAKRLKIDIEGLNEINPNWLHERFNTFISEDINEEYFFNDISNIKNIAFNKFEKLRSKE